MLLLEYYSLLKLLQSQKSVALPVEKQNVFESGNGLQTDPNLDNCNSKIWVSAQ